jgi:hypothetical protein
MPKIPYTDHSYMSSSTTLLYYGHSAATALHIKNDDEMSFPEIHNNLIKLYIRTKRTVLFLSNIRYKWKE